MAFPPEKRIGVRDYKPTQPVPPEPEAPAPEELGPRVKPEREPLAAATEEEISRTARPVVENPTDDELFVTPGQEDARIAEDFYPTSRGMSAAGPDLDANDFPAEFIDPDTGLPFSRKSTVRGEEIEIPDELKRPGWDYQLIAVSILNEPVTGLAAIATRDASWRDVTAQTDPQLYKLLPHSPTNDGLIEIGGLRLMRRPMYLTVDANRENYSNAMAQTRRNLIDKQKAPEEIDPRKVVWKRSQFDVQGEAGHYRR